MKDMDKSPRWFWDGLRWCQLSSDGRWHWDGQNWHPTHTDLHLARTFGAPPPKLSDRLKHLPRWLLWRWAAWSLFLVAWVPVMVAAAAHHSSVKTLIVLGSCLGGVAVVSTVALGSSLGHRRAWGYLGWSILVGAVFLGLTIFVAFSSSVPANQPDDPGTGIGAMFVTVACVAPMTLLLYAGSGVGALVRRMVPTRT
jgi:hypothetical protein